MTYGDKNKRLSAALKAAIIVAALAGIVAVLSYFISLRDLEILKHSLSLWSLVALVTIINIVSAIIFFILFQAWHWVRRDLKPSREDGLDV